MEKDKGLKNAVRRQQSSHLPFNFTFLMMQKVEESVRLQERRAERYTLWATITASLMLLGASIVTIRIYCSDYITQLLVNAQTTESEISSIPSFYLLILLAIPIFLLFDHWMRKEYFKRHQDL